MKLWKKIVITIGLGILASSLWQAFSADSMELRLRSDFLEWNDKFFYGALPTNTEIKLTDLSDWNDIGMTVRDHDGRYKIYIDRKTNPVWRQAMMTEVHEMCHVKNMMHMRVAPGTTVRESDIDAHGPAFESCMLGVAKIGGMKGLW